MRPCIIYDVGFKAKQVSMPKTARFLSFRAGAIVSASGNLYAENTKARLFGQNGKYREKGDEKR